MLAPATMSAMLIAACLASGARAADYTLSPKDFKENLFERTPVSGNQLVGVVVDLGSKPSPGGLRVFVPPGQAKALAVRMVSRDGLYEAVASFELAWGMQGKLVTLRIPTSKIAKWSTFGRLDLAVLVQSVAESVGTPLILPAMWGNDSGGPTALVNRGNATFTGVNKTGSSVEPMACTDLEDQTSIAFDTRCNLGPLISGALTPLSLIRKSFERSFPLQHFVIAAVGPR